MGSDSGLVQTVRRAQAANETAFEELVREFGPRVHRYLVARIGEEEEARDALQETLIAAWRDLPRLRHPERFWSWLVGIAAHKASDVVRRQLPSSTSDSLDDQNTDEKNAYESTAISELGFAIEALPKHLKDVLMLRYLLGLSERETGRALEIGVGTVKSRSWRARRSIERFIHDDV